MEQPDRVRAAADRRHQHVRQAPLKLQDLRPRLAPDHALEIAHQHRIGMRPRRRADDVERVRHIRHPVAQRLVHRVLERARARRHRHDLRAQQAHAEHVWLLPLHIRLAHEHNARQSKPRTDRRRRNTVLPRPRLRDDPRLAHAPGQQHLPDAVVDLVRARVVQLVALEIDFRPAEMLCEPLGVVHRARPPDIMLQQPVELRLEARISLGPRILLLEIEHERHQRLGHIPPAKLPEPPIGVGPLRPGIGRRLRGVCHGGPIDRPEAGSKRPFPYVCLSLP